MIVTGPCAALIYRLVVILFKRGMNVVTWLANAQSQSQVVVESAERLKLCLNSGATLLATACSSPGKL
jgi:hypothetical protein